MLRSFATRIAMAARNPIRTSSARPTRATSFPACCLRRRYKRSSSIAAILTSSRRSSCKTIQSSTTSQQMTFIKANMVIAPWICPSERIPPCKLQLSLRRSPRCPTCVCSKRPRKKRKNCNLCSTSTSRANSKKSMISVSAFYTRDLTRKGRWIPPSYSSTAWLRSRFQPLTIKGRAPRLHSSIMVERTTTSLIISRARNHLVSSEQGRLASRCSYRRRSSRGQPAIRISP